MNRDAAIKMIIEAFPSLKKELLEDAGLTGLQMSTFAEYLQSAIDSQDKETVGKGLQLAKQFLKQGDEEVCNSLQLSFLKNLDFEDSNNTNRSWAKKLLVSPLLEAYDEIKENNRRS